MSFVVDSSEWHFDNKNPDSIIQSIENLLERFYVASERKEKVWIGDDLQTKHIFEDYDLWSLLSPSSPIKFSQDLIQELSSYLVRANRYEDEEHWPKGFAEHDVAIEGEQLKKNLDLAWAHFNSKEGNPVGCFSLFREGEFLTESAEGSVPIYWVKSEIFHRKFWRFAIKSIGGDENTLRKFSRNAFPDLFFQPTVWGGMKDLAGGYYAIRDTIQKYLSILDDFGFWVFTAPPPMLSPFETQIMGNGKSPTNEIIQRRFLGLGLNMAPENPDVYLNKTCREAREIKISPEKTLYCEWHGKLESHQNRLHIYRPIEESGEKIIIAIFHTHLPLP